MKLEQRYLRNDYEAAMTDDSLRPALALVVGLLMGMLMGFGACGYGG